jgi:hypothetical protein
MDNITLRIRRAQESILENEALMADLDDAAAKVLLRWCLELAEGIAQSTAGLEDMQVQTVLDGRLRGVRRLMQAVNSWAAAARGNLDPERAQNLLEQMVAQAPLLYGEGYLPPGRDRQDAFLRQFSGDIQQFVPALRSLLESPAPPAAEVVPPPNPPEPASLPAQAVARRSGKAGQAASSEAGQTASGKAGQAAATEERSLGETDAEPPQAYSSRHPPLEPL